MDELATWLRAQLDEDERLAEACANAFANVADERLDLSKLYPDVQNHIYRWTPAHVLDQVEAKRRILAVLTVTLATASEHFTVESCDEDDAILAEATLRLLALPYAGREGWREEWRP